MKRTLLLSTLIGLVAISWLPTRNALASSSPCVAPITSWSLARRLDQLLMVSAQFSNPGASASEAAAGVGGFVFFGQPPAGAGPSIQAGLSSLYANAANSGSVAPWMSTDEEGGNVERLSYVIGSLPTPRYMATYWSTAQVQSAMARHGSAMRSLGVDMDLAPVLDTASPYDTVADEKDRSFSESGNVAAAYGMAYSNGLRISGVVPVVKHFPGMGHANANTDLSPAVDPPLSTLETNDLIPFARAISYGLPLVMVSHVQVPGLSGTAPASLSSATYAFLRNNLQFEGVSMTDSLGAVAVSAAGYTQAGAAVTALRAGADMVMIDSSQWPATLNALTAAINSGSLSLSAVDASVARVLATKGIQQVCPAAWLPMGGIVVGAPAVASWASGRLDLFVRGTDDALYHRWSANGGATWSGWQSLGGVLRSAPTAVSWGPNRIDTFVIGTDRAIWHKSWNGVAWSGWQSLGGYLAFDAPAVATVHLNHLDVFARGTDNQIWHTWWDGTTWRAWQTLGGATTAGPAAVSWGPGRLDLFIRGEDNAAWHRYWDLGGWHPWESLGGYLRSAPSAASPGAGKLELFALAPGNVLDYRSLDGTWVWWRLADGNVWSTNPGSVSGSPGVIDLIDRGLDGGLWFRTMSGF